MKKLILIFGFIYLSIYLSICLSAQPDSWSWNKDRNYISPAKDQKVQGPCKIFAAVAAVEAIAHIYFYKSTETLTLDLSESNLFSETDCGLGCIGASDVDIALDRIKYYGIVDEYSFQYPATSPYCREDCYTNYRTKMKIPRWSTLSVSNNTDLKKAIMDYGPIIVRMEDDSIGCVLHPGEDCKHAHTVLVTGWESNPVLKWEIKDSWPGDPILECREVDFFSYGPTFFMVRPFSMSGTIDCEGEYCDNFFVKGPPQDIDKDGFYNWGFDTLPKPQGCPGPDKMDFNDGDSTIIFRVGYELLPAPYLTGPSYVCSQQRTFTLHNVPSLFLQDPDSIEWEVTPSYYFDTPRSGKGDTVVNINPYPGYIGKQGEIKFTLRHNGKVEYKRSFIITGPREDLVSISVIDSYGGSPPKYGDIYYICPNTIYHIYYNNYDSNCSTWDYDWVLPYGWSEYWRYGNMISVNTNDYPYGMLEVWGKTCCESQSQSGIKLKTQYFYDYYECGEYFMAFPNPANSYVDIDINREKMAEENIRTDEKCMLTLYDKTGLVKYKTEFRGFPFRIETVNLLEGVYLINLLYDGKIYSMRVVIEH